MQDNCIKIHKARGELARAQLLKVNAFDSARKIVREGDYLYIPVNSNFDSGKLTDFPSSDVELVQHDCPIRTVQTRNYRDLLTSKLSPELINDLPRAFDIIGQVAVIKIPEVLVEYQAEIGTSIISANKNVRSVYSTKGVHDEYRLPELELIAGVDDSVTVQKEFGIGLELDVKKVYYSPRLATERSRIASQVQKGENIVDMFSGVGPFSIMISRYASPNKIYAIDKNPDAVLFLKRNIMRNAVRNIEPVEGDARDIMKNIDIRGQIDRIIMNLPHSGYEFLDAATDSVVNGGIINYYEILIDTQLTDRISAIEEKIRSHGMDLEMLQSRKIHSYSPKEALTGFDMKIHKSP